MRMVVLGAGPGGYTAAFRAADLGLDTVLVERYATSAASASTWAASVQGAAARGGGDRRGRACRRIGISFGAPKIDLDKLRAYKDKVVGQLTKGLAGMAKQRKVRTVQGVGAFVSPTSWKSPAPTARRSCCASSNASSPPVRRR
jgi:dihydrolipoamide dehydrogenase